MSRSWMGTFEGAFCEFEENLFERIGSAKTAIDGRLHELHDNSCMKKRTL